MTPQSNKQSIVASPLWTDFQKWWGNSKKSAPLYSGIFYEHHPVYSALSTDSNNAICVIDIPSMKYLYTSPNFSEWIGWDEGKYIEDGLRFVFDQLHSDDQLGATLFSEIINKYFEALPRHQRSSYKAFWDFRIKNSHDQYTRVLQRDCVLKSDEDGGILELAVFSEKIENVTTGQYQRLRLTNGFDNTFYCYDHKSKYMTLIANLSKRELQIVHRVAKAWPLKNIAEDLSISFNTVKVHSQNIMEKLKVRSSLEMVTLLRAWGFI